WTFLTASTAEHFDYIKMLLRSKSLDVQGFSAAGYWNARRVLTPSRTPAALSSAREATFFDSLKPRNTKPCSGACLFEKILSGLLTKTEKRVIVLIT
ncbi:MAG: hypothetical protein J6J19_02875, partial [Oscillospiraceae bacterium]|nr:hypothetical protein [Oscillospiraceae bacterium]